MANTSTPRLKVYRLDSNYSEENDSDIQSMSNDELLPVVVKDLNPKNTEEMVGVRTRQDGRIVLESGYYTVDVPMTLSGGQIQSQGAVCCEGWVLGKGNIDVFVFRGKAWDSEATYPTVVSANGDSETYADYTTGQWLQLDRRFWDFTVESQKTYVASGVASTTQPSSGDYEIHEMDWVTFRIGNMLTKSKRFFKGGRGYEDYIPIVGENAPNKIIVRYKQYRELGSSATFSNAGTGDYRAPFGDIYNGNINGRCLHLRTTDSEYTPIAQPKHLVEAATVQVDHAKMNYYEGNYLFKRKIYPFRVKVLQDSSVSSGDFEADAEISGGRAVVESELSWYMDDIMKPVVFERITVGTGQEERKLYKQLTRKQVTVQYQSTSEGGDHYIVTFNPTYYGTGVAGSYKFPHEAFLAYNYVDDSLGNVFDFDYDYMQSAFDTRSASVGYGHANDGLLATTPSLPSDFATNIYVKREILAVRNDAGRDLSRDLQLVQSSSTVYFDIPSSNFGSVFTVAGTAEEIREKNRLINGLAFFDPSHGMRVYVDGKLVCSLDTTTTSQSNQTIDGTAGYTVSYNTGGKRVSITGADVTGITEVLLIYYEKHPISFAASGGENPYCIGYRVPCYEKCKTSTLFVSSFPNWLKGHVNNDLDMFYGNKLYSGTELKQSTLENYHDIYPEYVKDGWYAMYAEGAVEFNEAKTEQNYFDVMNYGTFATEPDDGTWLDVATNLLPDYWAEAQKLALQYKKVRYNVAHYDGIYSVVRGRMTNYSNKNGMYRYAILEDDDNPNAAGMRWVGREDSSVRRMLEIGRDEAPKVIRGSNPEGESGVGDTLSMLSDVSVVNQEITTVNTENDRVEVFAIPVDAHVVFSFWANPTPTQTVVEALDNEDYVRVHASFKNATIGGETVKCLAFGLENSALPAGGSTFRTKVFGMDASIDWVLMPDTDDVYLGEAVGDVYNGVDISAVQTSEITIDGKTMTWFVEEDPTQNGSVDTTTRIVPLTDTSKLRRYRYHDDSVNWSYDVYFEVLSYRYSPSTGDLNCVEIAVYRVVTK